MADENNTLILRCRVICQEHGAYYTPHIRIITTIDGEVHDRRRENLFQTYKSPMDDTCDVANRIRDYEFRITALNDTLNESIATCVLFYQSSSENFTEHCYTSTLAWIILPNQPTTVPPTTTIGPTTDTTTQEMITTTIPPPTSTGSDTIIMTNITTQETTLTEKPASTLGSRKAIIPEEVSITFIVIVALVVICIMVVLIVGVCFVYRRFGKTRKRKISVQPLEEDRSEVIRTHRGLYDCEDIEGNESVDDAVMRQHATSTVKLRTPASS